MRVSILALMSLALIQAADARASDTPSGAKEIVLSAELAGEVSGTTVPEQPATFFMHVPTRRDFSIRVAADNGPCGFDIRRSSSSGFQSDVTRFPASRKFTAQEGETFIFSFFQTRTAFVERKGCSFTLSVN
ncbi:MAG TPA: hypothetical protein VN112_09780 [Ensifer sp.]|nr:hypothetical protein [Ensifer sp.]